MKQEKLGEAAPCIERALRSLEMLKELSKGSRRLATQHRVENYYNILIENVVELQKLLVTDDEYTASVAKGMARVNRQREYTYNVTQNNKGDVFYDVHALLPLKEMRKNVIFNRKRPSRIQLHRGPDTTKKERA